MQSPRLPRFRRFSTPAPMEIVERDRQIIRLVHRHRFLRSSHLVALIGGSPQPILRRLQLLFHHGYLERPRAQLDYYHRGGSREIVYGLGNKGEAWLQTESGISPRKKRWGEKNRAVSRPYLEHALCVSDVMVAFELACRQKGDVRLLLSEDFPRTNRIPLTRWQVSLTQQLKLGVMPDRIFALEFPSPHGHLERILFFLEADRGTMPVMRQNLSQSSFYRKLLAYEATWSQSIHRKRFGFDRLRVLTATSSDLRVTSLIEACAQLKRGHGIFLFAHRRIIKDPAGILDAVWQSGRIGETASLLN